MTSTTRTGHWLWAGRQVRHWLAVACVAAAATAGWAPVAAPADAPKVRVAAAAGVVTVKDWRLTVDVRDAELADVLGQVAAAAGFHLTTTGPLGRLTTAFSARTVEEGLRRLVQDHEMMLVYRPAEKSGGPAVLMEVQVFASGLARGGSAAPGPSDAAGRAALIAEITRFVRARDIQRGVPRLTEVLATSPDSGVRERAVWGLSALGGPGASAALSAALRDQEPSVRGQAAHALRRVAGAGAIPALSGVLASDPNVSVRRAAARALGMIGTPEADAALIAVTDDPDGPVRAEARGALNRQSARPR